MDHLNRLNLYVFSPFLDLIIGRRKLIITTNNNISLFNSFYQKTNTSKLFQAESQRSHFPNFLRINLPQII